MTCKMGAESNLNSSTPRVRAIRHLPFRPSALASVILRRVSTREHETPCCERHAYASACCPAHSFKINACYNLLLLRTYTFICRREGCRREGSNILVIERDQHTRHSKTRSMAQAERLRDGYRCSFLLSSALIHCCYRKACTQSSALAVVIELRATACCCFFL